MLRIMFEIIVTCLAYPSLIDASFVFIIFQCYIFTGFYTNSTTLQNFREYDCSLTCRVSHP